MPKISRSLPTSGRQTTSCPANVSLDGMRTWPFAFARSDAEPGTRGLGLAVHIEPAAKRKTMNTLTRWDPFKEMEDLQGRFAKFFGLTQPRVGNEGREALTVAEWAPSVDITEDDKEYLVKADLPEVKKEDVRLTVQDDVMSISGERKYEKEEKGKKYHRVERAYGSFMRSFTLPEDADGSKVSAEYKEGVLKVHLPKSEKTKPKSIEVKVS